MISIEDNIDYRLQQNRHISLEERFWVKVDKKGENECWKWKGAKGNHGYGLIRYNGKTELS